MFILLIFAKKPGHLRLTNDLFRMHSCWSYLRAFFEIFGIQVYFLWILQTQKRRVLVSKQRTLIWYPTTVIYAAAILFVVVVYLAVNLNQDRTVVVDDPETVYEGFVQTPLGLAEAVISVLIQLFSFPFQFYIGKDFFFMLWDELKHRSISKKIDELKRYTSSKDVYTMDMLQQVDADTYEVVR